MISLIYTPESGRVEYRDDNGSYAGVYLELPDGSVFSHIGAVEYIWFGEWETEPLYYFDFGAVLPAGLTSDALATIQAEAFNPDSFGFPLSFDTASIAVPEVDICLLLFVACAFWRHR